MQIPQKHPYASLAMIGFFLLALVPSCGFFAIPALINLWFCGVNSGRQQFYDDVMRYEREELARQQWEDRAA